MNKPKPANISFLILIVLFILSQTALVLSASWTENNFDQVAYQNEISADSAILSENNNESSISSYDKSSQFKELIEEKNSEKPFKKKMRY